MTVREVMTALEKLNPEHPVIVDTGEGYGLARVVREHESSFYGPAVMIASED